MDRMREIQYVSGHLYSLQGLRVVPFGILYLIAAAVAVGAFDWVPFRHAVREGAWTMLLLVIAVITSQLIGSRYGERYGTASRVRRWKTYLLIYGWVLALFVILLLDDTRITPMPASALFVGASLFMIAVTHRPFRRHYSIVAVVFCALTALPYIDWSPVTKEAVLCSSIGLGIIALGVGDHLTLMQALEERPVHDPAL